MTLTLASVYIPLAFIQVLFGQLFTEFAITLTGAVLISGIVALTPSTMMCSKLLLPRVEYPKKAGQNAEMNFLKNSRGAIKDH